MRRLARQFRRLSLTLPILYLACFGVLAVVLPYVPRLQFAVESPVTTLVGFSPDGHTLATTEGILLLSTAEVDNDYQGEPFRFWNVAPHRNGGNAKPLADAPTADSGGFTGIGMSCRAASGSFGNVLLLPTLTGD